MSDEKIREIRAAIADAVNKRNELLAQIMGTLQQIAALDGRIQTLNELLNEHKSDSAPE